MHRLKPFWKLSLVVGLTSFLATPALPVSQVSRLTQGLALSAQVAKDLFPEYYQPRLVPIFSTFETYVKNLGNKKSPATSLLLAGPDDGLKLAALEMLAETTHLTLVPLNAGKETFLNDFFAAVQDDEEAEFGKIFFIHDLETLPPAELKKTLSFLSAPQLRFRSDNGQGGETAKVISMRNYLFVFNSHLADRKSRKKQIGLRPERMAKILDDLTTVRKNLDNEALGKFKIKDYLEKFTQTTYFDFLDRAALDHFLTRTLRDPVRMITAQWITHKLAIANPALVDTFLKRITIEGLHEFVRFTMDSEHGKVNAKKSESYIPVDEAKESVLKKISNFLGDLDFSSVSADEDTPIPLRLSGGDSCQYPFNSKNNEGT